MLKAYGKCTYLYLSGQMRTQVDLCLWAVVYLYQQPGLFRNMRYLFRNCGKPINYI